jgi:hypothetical protein
MSNKNITITYDKLDELRRHAAEDNTSVNQLIRGWSDDYIAKKRNARLKAIDESLKYFSFKDGRIYTREEMNKR